MLFRRESGRLISILTRIFGPQNLELAEDVVQESFVAAMGLGAYRALNFCDSLRAGNKRTKQHPLALYSSIEAPGAGSRKGTRHETT